MILIVVLKIQDFNILHVSFYNSILALLQNTCEENPLQVYIILDTNEDMGLSSNDKLHIIELYRHPSEGIIYFKFRGDNDYYELKGYPEFISQIYYYLL